MRFLTHVHHGIHSRKSKRWRKETNAKADAVTVPATCVDECTPDILVAGLGAGGQDGNEDDKEEQDM